MWNDLKQEVKMLRQYSTPLGNIWYVIQFIFRLLIVSMIGSQVYGDEQGQFKCDTNQPGCQNVCYNRFSPVSHMRFWSIQMLFLSMPKFVFHAYITLVINNKKVLDRACEKLKETETEARADFSDDDSSVRNSQYSDIKTARAYEKIEKKKKKYMIRESQIKKKNHVDDRGNLEEVIWTPGIRLGYLVHLFFQAAIEALFLWLAYKLQQNQTRKTGWTSFRVPERYDCYSDEHTKPPWGDESVTACGQSKEIPCWVSRPWEKSLFVLYMSGMALISIIISVAEFIYMSSHMGVKGYKRRKVFNKEKNLLWTQDKTWNPYENPDYQQKLREHNMEHGSLSRRRMNSRSTSGYQTPTRRDRPFPPPKNNQHETSVLIEAPPNRAKDKPHPLQP